MLEREVEEMAGTFVVSRGWSGHSNYAALKAKVTFLMKCGYLVITKATVMVVVWCMQVITGVRTIQLWSQAELQLMNSFICLRKQKKCS